MKKNKKKEGHKFPASLIAYLYHSSVTLKFVLLSIHIMYTVITTKKFSRTHIIHLKINIFSCIVKCD